MTDYGKTLSVEAEVETEDPLLSPESAGSKVKASLSLSLSHTHTPYILGHISSAQHHLYSNNLFYPLATHCVHNY